MKRPWLLTAIFLAATSWTLSAWPGASRADGVLDWLHPARHKYKKQEPYKPDFGAHNTPPLTMVQLANVIDILERDLREDGTLVIQQPSVWGQARMTVYRKDFDNEMKKDLEKFSFVISARIARSDQASFESQTGLAASLSAGATGKTGTGGAAAPPAPIPIADLSKSLADLLKQAKDSDPIKMQQAFDLLNGVFKDVKTGLDPPIFLDEKKRYLDHLNELRRINMGDDIADSAGYGLYLVRMPVSIEPGQKTLHGHGAMLTVTAEHDFGPSFLQRTFRNLVINDLVDQFTPILFEILDQGLDKGLEDTLNELRNPPREFKKQKTGPDRLDQRLPDVNDRNGQQKRAADIIKSEGYKRTKQQLIGTIRIPPIPAKITNGKAYPVAPSDLISVFAVPGDIAENPTAMECALHFLVTLSKAQHTARPRATDIRLFLQRELEAAYEIMERGLDGGDIPLSKMELMESIVKSFHNRSFGPGKPLDKDFRNLMTVMQGKVAHDHMGFLCWAIAVDAALLNDQLRADIERINGRAGFHCHAQLPGLFFYLPPAMAASELSLTAAQVFEDYVRARWPLITFSLDPVVDQQNIADALSIRRDLQLAVAFAFSTGQISFNQMDRFHRQMGYDADTIALNRTVTCFSHRNDTFGWRFAPRYQNPPPESNPRVLASLLVRTGPHPNYQQNRSKLERGQRELTAVIVMPSFLNTIRMDVRGNYFKLTHPENLTISSGRMLEQGRVLKELMETNASAVCDAEKYRPDDIRHLHVKLQQVEKMLPMQTYQVNVPYENTLGGFDLFVPGTTALVPILIGYDAVDQVPQCVITDATCSQTAFFLYGKHFSILETKVVAGGRYVPDTDVEILSREVMRVKIQKDVQTTQIRGNRTFVEIHVATPNGISNRVLIPFQAKDAAPKAAPKDTTPKDTTPSSEYTLKTTTLPMQYFWKDKKITLRPLDPSIALKIDRLASATGLAPDEMEVRFTLATTDGKVKLDPKFNARLKQRADGKTSNTFTITNDKVADMAQGILSALAAANILVPDKPGPAELVSVSIQGVPPALKGIRNTTIDVAEKLKVTIELAP
jgi:hypothetical protein